MKHVIGAAAGKVYDYLDKNKGTALPTSRVKSGAGVKGPLFDQAIGWLSREDKLNFERKGKSILISLK